MSDPSPQPAAASPTDNNAGYRLPNGEWRPSKPVEYAPLFVWPPRPRDVLKWALSYPGFLWPWNSVYLALTVVTWLYFQPALERCVTFQPGWIAQMYLRNLVLIWIVFGGWHLLLYKFRVQGDKNRYDPRPFKKNKTFLFGDQVYENVFYTTVSGCTIWTAYEVLLIWAYANKLIPYVDWREHPIHCAVWLCLIPFWREFHFYWTHRLVHCKPLYKHFHYLHHKNVNIGPWSGMSMHPVEHIVYLSAILIHWIIPSHPLHMLFTAQQTALMPAAGHNGFDGPVLDGKIPGGSYFHYLHHRYFECNYGESTLPLDRLFGTFRDGTPGKAQPGVPDKTSGAA